MLRKLSDSAVNQIMMNGRHFVISAVSDGGRGSCQADVRSGLPPLTAETLNNLLDPLESPAPASFTFFLEKK